MLTTANNHYQQGRFDEAKATYLDAVAADPSNVEALERLGTIALLENQSGEARRLLGMALRQRPFYRRSWPFAADLEYRIAMTHYREDDFGGAAAWFRRAAGPIAIGPFRDLNALACQSALLANGKSYALEGPDKTHIDFLTTDPLPVVEISANGHGPLTFFIDTGAAEIILDREIASRVGAQLCGSLRSDYAGQKTAATGLGSVDSVKVGDLVVRHLPIHTLDVKAMSAEFGREIHGILGTRLLMHFLSTIDYPNGTLTLHRLDSQSTASSAARIKHGAVAVVPFLLAEMHCILARGSLNGLDPMLLFVDTGLANAGFTGSRAILQQAGIEVDWSKATTGIGGAGEVREASFSVERLTLGVGANSVSEMDIRGVAMEGSVSILEGKLGFSVGGLISHQFFRKRSLTFDFSAMQLVLA